MILYADIPAERLDAFLARSVEGLSRSAAQKLIEDGCVKRNGGNSVRSAVARQPPERRAASADACGEQPPKAALSERRRRSLRI